eukprot:gnl/TRDRNA2_/TRDRNA2_54292_c0_seq1.p1 gnl/TRDRNA2_/TRDRNA2_54292_c0~~gnl/TRDRNA2_/TRDRNA2_54292_c0_seq1.p1  ORF type:complete len:335 (-),score=43.14 gnl/TRDRNA2_/TRDRNA2_54292_c0_seq1:279-1283(-)
MRSLKPHLAMRDPGRDWRRCNALKLVLLLASLGFVVFVCPEINARSVQGRGILEMPSYFVTAPRSILRFRAQPHYHAALTWDRSYGTAVIGDRMHFAQVPRATYRDVGQAPGVALSALGPLAMIERQHSDGHVFGGATLWCAVSAYSHPRRSTRACALIGFDAFGSLPRISQLLPESQRQAWGPVADNLGSLAGFVIIIVINAKINDFRREQEMKAFAAVGKAVANKTVEATTSAVQSVSSDQWQKLVLCILVDIGGDASFLLPGLGELSDVAYAPLEGFLLSKLFGSSAISGIGFVEEALPFTDEIPTATLAWVVETFWPESPVGKLLGLSKK